MLILLPPSEGKAQSSSSEILNLDELSFASALTKRRREVIESYETDISLSSVSAAIDIYTGVLYQALGYHSLSAGARERADSQILISSALFGVLRTRDKIPYYKSKMKSGDWNAELAPTLDDLETELIVDCRSSTYASSWKPNPAITVAVRVFQIKNGERSVITHMSKKYRGELARKLVQGKTLKKPQELGFFAQKFFNAELVKPSEKLPYQLNLLIPAP